MKVKVRKVVKVKVKVGSVIVWEWTYVLQPLEVKVTIEVPPPLILNRTRLVFHQFSNSTKQVLAIEGLLLLFIVLADKLVIILEPLENLEMLDIIIVWKLS